MTWRNTSIVLAALCTVLLWRSCSHAHDGEASPEARTGQCTDRTLSRWSTTDERRDRTEAEPEPELATGGITIAGVQVPGWATWFLPRAGEDMLAYRDRLVPVVQAAIAPHRARVARSRDDFAAATNLDARQRGELDAAAAETASAIEERVMSAVLSGDFSPSTFKPMTGVDMARDVIDAIEHGNQRFLSSLTDDQRAALGQHPFDFSDYLLFSTRWEDALGYTK
jgi:hypothetical protein